MPISALVAPFARRQHGVALAACVLVLAGCSGSVGGQPSASAPMSSSPASGAGASAGASVAAGGDMGAEGSAGPAATAPFLTSDCATPGAPTPSDTAPADATTFGSVSVRLADQGVPFVTVAADAQAGQEVEAYDLSVGDGPEVKDGDVITFNYCGVGMTTRQMFDSSWTRGEPLTYSLDELIPGWALGIPSMKVGGERLLIIPGDLAYGPNPSPDSGILPNETLIFVVEVLGIEPAPGAS